MNVGVWDSIHVFEVLESHKPGIFEYKLTTTAMVSMQFVNDKVGKVDLSGSMTQQSAQSHPVSKDRPHISNMGRMLEDMELKIRNAIEAVYIQKTREIYCGIRSPSAGGQKLYDSLAQSLRERVGDYGKGRKKDTE